MMKTYQNHAMTDAEARQALADACKQVETNLPLYTYQCQNHSSVNNIYPGCANNQWTCGFWPGEIWLAYEATGDEKFKTAALIQVDSFADRIARKVEVDHHDMGFLYSPTCVAAWKLVGSEKGKNAAIAAADQLLTRYQPSGRFLQAWGTMDDPGNYRYIIDCMLNVPLLYWAAQVTGSDHYREIAAAHTATTLANSFRPDGSTYHTFFMNPDGTPKGGRTCQGYKDDSFWARGQAWGVYGSAIGYTYTHDEKFLDVFRKALAFYLSRLPEDMIPCWDMLFAPESGESLLGYDLYQRRYRAAGFLLGLHRGLRPAGSSQVCGRNRSCPVAHAGTADAGQPCRKLRSKARHPRLRPAAARHLQQKKPLQHLHPGGRG